MAGEKSKKSGEIGEKIAISLLDKIGWKHQIQNLSITCNNEKHKNHSGKKKSSHGEDSIYIYDTPFHDEKTVVAHISIKNATNGYPTRESEINSTFKKHIEQLSQIIECAEYDQEVNSLIQAFGAKKNLQHIGVLVWLHNDEKTINKDILKVISKSRLGLEGNTPYYVIDAGRASFLFQVINDLGSKSKNGNYQFYYPRIGTSITVNTDRSNSYLPIGLIVSDIIPAVVTIGECKKFYLYVREEFDELTYKNMMAYALNFSAGLVNEIYIGFPNYNPVKDNVVTEKTRIFFKDRKEMITPFSYNKTFLELIK
ncbi:GapS4a family protein [Rodentibacter haemolyticus]|uniref:GAPS4 PD-(D/E)XK nuclease domain-containing protein n=1 Tax=Rodentibacter haemolyticus TaxID=2778911 RepID=A0ABX6UY17_9PAST|nr:hypothetical protein [Rodentibacter haemolyticus]QPB42757.1 hypothetical protein IHV77_01110 [Rodentibacter haemolyticus]